MKLYAAFEPSGGGGWGDCFPALFFTEWLKQNDANNELEIFMYDLGAQAWGMNDWRLRDHIQKPDWIAEWVDDPPVIKDFGAEAVLATHFSHPPRDLKTLRAKNGLETAAIKCGTDPLYGGWLPPGEYADAEFGLIRLHNDAWWATLADILHWRPTMPELFNTPTRPDEPFVAIQLRRDEPDHKHKPGRNALSGENFDRWARNYIHSIDGPVVLLSDQVETDHPNVIDASKFTLWEKIYLASKAKEFHGAHSGFGAICASYSKSSFVINTAEDGAHRNPSLAVFDNVRHIGMTSDTYAFKGPYVTYEGTLEIDPC